MAAGEYDPLCTLEDAWTTYQELAGPREFWLLENDFHQPFSCKGLADMPVFPYLADWLSDALDGRLPANLRREVVVGDRSGAGPYGEQTRGFWLPERAEVDLPAPAEDPLQGYEIPPDVWP